MSDVCHEIRPEGRLFTKYNSPRKDESAAMIEKVQIIADEMQPHSRPARIISMKDVAITILSE